VAVFTSHNFYSGSQSPGNLNDEIDSFVTKIVYSKQTFPLELTCFPRDETRPAVHVRNIRTIPSTLFNINNNNKTCDSLR